MIVSECDGIRMATLQNKTALVTGASSGIWPGDGSGCDSNPRFGGSLIGAVSKAFQIVDLNGPRYLVTVIAPLPLLTAFMVFLHNRLR